MKNKILKKALVVIVATVAGYGVYQAQSKETTLSEVGLANIEALANDDETDQSCGRYCYNNSNEVCKKLGDWGFCVGTRKTMW